MFSFLKNLTHQFVTGLTCHKLSWRKLKKILPVVLLVTIIFVGVAGPIFYSTAHAQVTEMILKSLGMDLILKVINAILQTITWIISGFLLVAGWILDLSVKQTIVKFADLTGGTSLVGIGWTVIRDLSNLIFIFLILWVAISTILGLGSGDTMKSVLRIAIAALLINFSLFIAKAIIDVSNILALHFYNLITADGTGSFSGVFMEGLYLQTLYDPAKVGMLTDAKLTMTYAFGSIAMLVTIWVFLAAAIMFIIRALYLIVLMVLSPFAFIAWVVPGMSNHTHDWWHKLFHQAFFAPIFMVMIYIVGKTIQAGGTGAFGIAKGNVGFSDITTLLSDSGTGGAAAAAVSANDPSIVGIIINFIMLIGMLIASLLVANKLGAAGASTAISLGNKIRGAGQSWVGGRTVGKWARNWDEKLSKTTFGNTGVGKTLRGLSTGALKDFKWGGKHSAEERHKEDLELASKRKEAMEVQGGGGSGDHNARAIVGNIEGLKHKGESEIATLDAHMKSIEEDLKTAKADPTLAAGIPGLESILKDAKDKLGGKKKEVADELEKARGELQKILVKLSPHSFVEMMPKNMLFTPEIMRNASRSQLMAVLVSDKFAEIEKDKVRAARYGHIDDAVKKVKKENKNYEKNYREYTEFYEETAGPSASTTDVDAKIKRELDKLKLTPGSAERTKKEADIRAAIDMFKTATTPEEKSLAAEAGTELLKMPEKKSVGDVASDVRVWIRAMADQEIDEMYRFKPEMVADSDLTGTIRSSAIVYARKSENIASIDKDGFRDAKLRHIINANDLVDGIGELAPTYNTFVHTLNSLEAHGAKDIVDTIKKLVPDDRAFEEYRNGSEKSMSKWEKLKDDYLRKAVKKVAYEKGNRQKYLDSFNNEQKTLAAFGADKMITALGGQSNDEFPLLRGSRWRDPAFAEYFNKGMALEFKTKDTGDIKEIMDMVLFRLRDYLANPKKRISEANMDLLHWLVTETAGRNFITRNQINPELQETFDKMESIFGAIGRGNKVSYSIFEQKRKDLKIP